MRILISAYTFDPSIGGIETVSRLLGTEFVRIGHEVKVVTRTPESGSTRYPFEVIRRPAFYRLIGLLNWADLYFQVHISLLLAWPLLLIRKPWIVAQHTWLPENRMSEMLNSRLKRYLLRFATTVSVSRAIADDLHSATQIIGNPYDAAVFRRLPGVRRETEIVFVGRLVSDKGARLLVEALGILKSRGRSYRLTVVGQGAEEEALRRQVRELQLAEQVTFAGLQTGVQLAAILNAHQILVVPSLWQEPFGIVALEACACGCVVVGSEGGGLPEAIGPCGVTFPNGDSNALAYWIDQLCSKPALLERCRAAGQAHLATHTPRAAAVAYLRVFESTLTKAKQSAERS